MGVHARGPVTLMALLVIAGGLLIAHDAVRTAPAATVAATAVGRPAAPPPTATATAGAAPALSAVAVAAARLAAAPPPAPLPRPVAIEIPNLRVDAPVTTLAASASGSLGVPTDATTIGWYDFTALPGAAGNAVFAGHVDWAGRLGTFAHLASLQIGDRIVIRAGDASLTYRVDRTYSVPFDDDALASIFGSNDSEQAITLITCGGTFDRARREYLARTIVHAVRTDG